MGSEMCIRDRTASRRRCCPTAEGYRRSDVMAAAVPLRCPETARLQAALGFARPCGRLRADRADLRLLFGNLLLDRDNLRLVLLKDRLDVDGIDTRLENRVELDALFAFATRADARLSCHSRGWCASRQWAARWYRALRAAPGELHGRWRRGARRCSETHHFRHQAFDALLLDGNLRLDGLHLDCVAREARRSLGLVEHRHIGLQGTGTRAAARREGP